MSLSKENPLYKLFKQWCKETKRNGGVIVGSSIREFLDWLQNKVTVNE